MTRPDQHESNARACEGIYVTEVNIFCIPEANSVIVWFITRVLTDNSLFTFCTENKGDQVFIFFH